MLSWYVEYSPPHFLVRVLDQRTHPSYLWALNALNVVACLIHQMQIISLLTLHNYHAHLNKKGSVSNLWASLSLFSPFMLIVFCLCASSPETLQVQTSSFITTFRRLFGLLGKLETGILPTKFEFMEVTFTTKEFLPAEKFVTIPWIKLYKYLWASIHTERTNLCLCNFTAKVYFSVKKKIYEIRKGPNCIPGWIRISSSS